MKRVIDELRQLIAENRVAFAAISESIISLRPAPGKWSPKEVIGHLVDSAHNNLRRFISGQYESTPPHIWYDQEFWVRQNGYQEMNTPELIQLWVLMNERICKVLGNLEAADTKLVNTGRNQPQLLDLGFVAEDYVAHMKHHLKQIFREAHAL
jgi:hypothetical protein